MWFTLNTDSNMMPDTSDIPIEHISEFSPEICSIGMQT